MTDITERLAAIEARVEAADDGPWRVRGPQVDPSWKWAAGVESTSLDPSEVDTTIAEVVDAPDAEFIAHARTDIPWLVEQVRQRDEVIERVRVALAGHPECDRYPNDGGEPILCGWKNAVVDVRAALEGAES